MKFLGLQIAKCCGTCISANEKKRDIPEDHAPHYAVAKTERWCSKFKIPTVREAVCDEWTLCEKRGGAPAVKRALSQNRRLAKIIKLHERLEKEPEVFWKRYAFALVDGRVNYRWDGGSFWHLVSCKENAFDDFLFGSDKT